jgi:cob(I)alamin adenosyltransferase
LKVCFIQFCKGEISGEHLFIDRYPAFELLHPGIGHVFKSPADQLKKESQEILALAEQKIVSGQYDLIVLDEINIALYRGFLTIEQVLKVLDQKPPALELVLTGRYAAAEIVQRADLVTEMRSVKHPFAEGLYARLGIEY